MFPCAPYPDSDSESIFDLDGRYFSKGHFRFIVNFRNVLISNWFVFFYLCQDKSQEVKAVQPGDKLVVVTLCPGDACQMTITVPVYI